MTRPILAIKEDGTLLLRGLAVQVPEHWKASDTAGVYQCQMPLCAHRRYTYRILNGQLVVHLHCFLQRRNCTAEECASCPMANPDFGTRQKMEIETDHGDGTTSKDTAVFRVVTAPGPRHESQEPWIVQHGTPATSPRPDLQAIQDTLPPHKAGRDRTFRIEDDGTIVYAKEEGQWEPPKDINGYRRDPENAWRFIPLWPPCAMRHQMGVRYASCGCIGIVMRCNHPEHPKYMERIGHEDCQTCPHRKTEK